MFCLFTFRSKSFPILGFMPSSQWLFGCPENVLWVKLRVVADVCKPINLEDREASSCLGNTLNSRLVASI